MDKSICQLGKHRRLELSFFTECVHHGGCLQPQCLNVLETTDENRKSSCCQVVDVPIIIQSGQPCSHETKADVADVKGVWAFGYLQDAIERSTSRVSNDGLDISKKERSRNPVPDSVHQSQSRKGLFGSRVLEDISINEVIFLVGETSKRGIKDLRSS